MYIEVNPNLWPQAHPVCVQKQKVVESIHSHMKAISSSPDCQEVRERYLQSHSPGTPGAAAPWWGSPGSPALSGAHGSSGKQRCLCGEKRTISHQNHSWGSSVWAPGSHCSSLSACGKLPLHSQLCLPQPRLSKDITDSKDCPKTLKATQQNRRRDFPVRWTHTTGWAARRQHRTQETYPCRWTSWGSLMWGWRTTRERSSSSNSFFQVPPTE